MQAQVQIPVPSAGDFELVEVCRRGVRHREVCEDDVADRGKRRVADDGDHPLVQRRHELQLRAWRLAVAGGGDEVNRAVIPFRCVEEPLT